jgi:hypothetical protein
MVRLNYVSHLATATVTFFVDANTIAIWSTIELGLGIVASSLATLRPLFRTCLSTTRAYTTSSGDNSFTHFRSVKGRATVIELVPPKENLSMLDFEFIEGGFGSKAASIPHQHIPKEPWKPRAPTPDPPALNRPNYAKLQHARSPSRAEYVNHDPYRSYTPPQYGNKASCEGPYETVQRQPALMKGTARCGLHGIYRA